MIPLLLLLALGGLMQAARSFSPDISFGGTELAFGYLLLVAYFAARVVQQLKLPRLSGYLIAGAVSGPFVLGLVSSEMTGSLRVVNGVATCILGITAGAELNLKRIQPLKHTLRKMIVWGVIGSMFVMTGALVLLRPWIPWLDPAGASTLQSVAICALVGVALVPQSPAVVMAMLSETKADGPVANTMLASVVVADLVVVFIYSIVAAVTGAIVIGEIDVVSTVGAVLWELLGSVGFGIAIGALIGVFLRTVQGGGALFTLAMCIVVAEIGTRIHLDPLIVTLASGIWLENFSKADAHPLLQSFESAQLPVFLVWFALAGTRLDLAKLWSAIIPVMILVVVRGGAFWVGCKVACADAPPAVRRFGWVGLLPQAGLSLALVVVIQKNFPSFGAAAAVLMLSIVGVNQLLSPPLLRMAFVKSGEAGKKAGIDFAAGHD